MLVLYLNEERFNRPAQKSTFFDMVKSVRWKEEFKIGVSIIDNQHKQLFNIYAELNDSLQGGLRPEVVRKVLERLQQYVARHFAMEEKYMEESGYHGLEGQRVAHHYFSHQFVSLSEEFNRTGLTPQIVKTIKKELSTWLEQHIVVQDRKFGEYYNSRKDVTQNSSEQD